MSIDVRQTVVGWGEERTPALISITLRALAVGVRYAHPNLQGLAIRRIARAPNCETLKR